MKLSKSRFQTLELELEEVYLTLIFNYFILEQDQDHHEAQQEEFD